MRPLAVEPLSYIYIMNEYGFRRKLMVCKPPHETHQKEKRFESFHPSNVAIW